MIDQCLEIDPDFAAKTLTKPAEAYFNQSPISLAEANKSRAFLATRTMWEHFDRVWYGEINGKGHSKLFISFLVKIYQ